MKYLQKINENRAAPGLELVWLRCCPWAFILCVAVPAVVAFVVRAQSPASELTGWTRIDITAVAVALTGVTAVLTLTIGAAIVFVMKGPGYVADAYELDERPDPKLTQR